MELLPEEEYFKNLDRKRGSACVLIIKDGKLLVLETSYNAGIEMPGGRLDSRESPDEGAARECREELGVDVKLTQYLGMDYYRSTPVRGDSMHHTFLGEVGDQELRIDNKEVTGFKWVPVEEAVAFIAKQNPGLAAIVRNGLSAMDTAGGLYCKEGKPLFALPSTPKVVAPQVKPPQHKTVK